MELKVVLERGEDGFLVAHCPSLKSCWSQGRTREEALRNIREAIELYLEPEPDDEVDRFTLRGALRDADINPDDFLAQVR
jgi:predicted RNase H-like HicB family nuclease